MGRRRRRAARGALGPARPARVRRRARARARRVGWHREPRGARRRRRSHRPGRAAGAARPMSEPGYEIVSIDELERYPSPNDTQVMLPLRRRLGFRPFGLNVWLGENAGDRVIEAHREPEGTEELYVVLRGRARFTLGDESFVAAPGTLVHAVPGTFREATAVDAGTTILAMGAKAGEAFVPSGWEEFTIAFAKLRAGDVAGGRAVVA